MAESNATLGFTLNGSSVPRAFVGDNPRRRGVVICNQGPGGISVGFGSPSAYTGGILLLSGEAIIIDGPGVYRGEIWISTDGTNAAAVSGQEWN